MRVLDRLALGLHNDPHIPHIYQCRVTVPHSACTYTVCSCKHTHTFRPRRTPTPAVSLIAFLTSYVHLFLPLYCYQPHAITIPDSTSWHVYESEQYATQLFSRAVVRPCVQFRHCKIKGIELGKDTSTK